MSQAVQAVNRLARCATPDRAIQVQADAAAAAVQRLASLSAVLTELATASTAAALMPYHKRVTQNARRLARPATV
jgi:threonine synthase